MKLRRTITAALSATLIASWTIVHPLSSLAATSQKTKLPSCDEVRQYIAWFGVTAVVTYAREHGATVKQINRYKRKCHVHG